MSKKLPTVQVGTTVELQLRLRMEKLARKEGKSLSHIVREAIIYWSSKSSRLAIWTQADNDEMFARVAKGDFEDVPTNQT